ncbi:MAG: hypothetical protein IPG45_17995 [Deltaproteobacteria bacterium]|nr:hypothetical protein [Deltaproteobacteria bacterium]
MRLRGLWVPFFALSWGCISGNRPSTPDAGTTPSAELTPPPPPPGGTISMRPVVVRPAANTRTALGTNLAETAETDRSWAFLDLMAMSRTFLSKSPEKWDDGRSLNLDPNGYPTRLADDQEAVTLVPGGPGGLYVLTYEGSGEVKVGALEGRHRVLSEAPGRIALELVRDQPFLVAIQKTDPNDHLRNLKVLPKALEKDAQNADFHPLFLERVAQFRILRFMDWTVTNASVVRRWSQRSRPVYQTQAQPGGVAYEWLIRLANTVHADPWICVPHLADDDFVEQLARLLRANLDPELKVYLEFSNELWNDHPAFAQAAHARAEGARLGLSKDPNQGRLYWQARRSREVFQIFERIYGAEHPKRLVRVVASQVGNVWAHEQLLDFEGLRAHTDALAVAPYFGFESAALEAKELVLGQDLDWLLEHLRTKSLPETMAAIRASQEVAKDQGLPLIAYEGGQHLVSHPAHHPVAALQARYDAANRDPRMKALYLQLLEGWKEAGGHEFVHFTFARHYDHHNRFAMFERVDDSRSEAPKYDAILTFSAANPPWW